MNDPHRTLIPVDYDAEEVSPGDIRDCFHECTHHVDHTEVVFDYALPESENCDRHEQR